MQGGDGRKVNRREWRRKRAKKDGITEGRTVETLKDKTKQGKRERVAGTREPIMARRGEWVAHKKGSEKGRRAEGTGEVKKKDRLGKIKKDKNKKASPKKENRVEIQMA